MPAAVDITPDARLQDVLGAWPDLLPVLLALSPPLRALEDPFLRRTFGRAARLRQVARAGGVPLDHLLAELRRAAGLPPLAPLVPSAASPPAGSTVPEGAPDWARPERATAGRDVRAEVAAGVHPLPLVLADLERLPPDAVYELVTPMAPAPALDLLRTRGWESYTRLEPDGTARSWIRRAPAGGR